MDKVECAYDCWYGGFIIDDESSELKKGQEVQLDKSDFIPGASTIGLWDVRTYLPRGIGSLPKPIGTLTHDSTMRFQTPLFVTGETLLRTSDKELNKVFIARDAKEYSDLVIGELCCIKLIVPYGASYDLTQTFNNFFGSIQHALTEGVLPDIAVDEDGYLGNKMSTDDFLREIIGSQGNYQFGLLDPWYRSIGMPPKNQ